MIFSTVREGSWRVPVERWLPHIQQNPDTGYKLFFDYLWGTGRRKFQGNTKCAKGSYYHMRPQYISIHKISRRVRILTLVKMQTATAVQIPASPPALLVPFRTKKQPISIWLFILLKLKERRQSLGWFNKTSIQARLCIPNSQDGISKICAQYIYRGTDLTCWKT